MLVDSNGQILEFFKNNSNGVSIGLKGNIIMKDESGEGFCSFDRAVYYQNDEEDNYFGADDIYYRFDKNGDLVRYKDNRVTKD